MVGLLYLASRRGIFFFCLMWRITFSDSCVISSSDAADDEDALPSSPMVAIVAVVVSESDARSLASFFFTQERARFECWAIAPKKREGF